MRLHKLFLIPSAAAVLGACGPDEPQAVEEPALEEPALEAPATDLPRTDSTGAILDAGGVAEGQVLEPTIDPGPDSIPGQAGGGSR